jgi:predicted nucleic acid-binding protein
MIVVDASALASALVYADTRGRKTRAVLRRDTEWAAPEHWKVDVFAVLRQLAEERAITPEQAIRAVGRLPRLGVDSVPLDRLLPRMWQLRGPVSGYDAPYVALAAERGITLVCADGDLARAATPYCRVELIA